MQCMGVGPNYVRAWLLMAFVLSISCNLLCMYVVPNIIILIRLFDVKNYNLHNVSGTFDGDFNLVAWQFFLNRQTKITTNTISRGHRGSILWQSLANP